MSDDGAPALGAFAEQRLAELSESDFEALCLRVRPPAELTPKDKAAQALRHEVSGRTPGRPRATKERAAEALRSFNGGSAR